MKIGFDFPIFRCKLCANLSHGDKKCLERFLCIVDTALYSPQPWLNHKSLPSPPNHCPPRPPASMSPYAHGRPHKSPQLNGRASSSELMEPDSEGFTRVTNRRKSWIHNGYRRSMQGGRQSQEWRLMIRSRMPSPFPLQ